ncbi:unnamed protein product [Candida verbasci]|uniref:Glucan 1,3-beta-glucosidase n=1 Tax=Candida verbasci TaxID=1227364 RepID=A0A9W4U013_9ASCO|nr:unnamed protein product [Candida verbasci]
MFNLIILLLVYLIEFINTTPISSENNNGIKFKRIGGTVAWDYENDIVRGLNLGGWFVLEPYITPELFEAFGTDESKIPVDEYHYTQYLGKSEALNRLQQHWSTWYTEADFEQMSYLGINLVRIPIGYWAFDLLPNDPYVQGQVEYLEKAINWSRKHNLKVWIDLHGAAGSQNGFDNSGLRDHVDFQNGDNTEFTLNVLRTILKKYGAQEYSDVIVGIELLNEPLGPVLDMNKLKQFFTDAYWYLRNKVQSVMPVVIHDAFQQPGYWDGFLTVDGGAWNVVIDHHHYQVFSQGELQRNIAQHIQTACNWGWDTKKEYHWTVAGEWSAALTDCAKWLNGVGRGARYEGQYDNSVWIGSCDFVRNSTPDQWPKWYRTNVRKYIEAQLDAFEYTGGWVFWNFKTSGKISAAEWDFQKLTYYGLFPQPLTDRQFPNQCNFPSKK